MDQPDKRMRVVVNVGVVFDADTYKDAGRVLDRIDQGVREALIDKGRDEPRGKHEITGFQTRPCKAAKFDQMAYGENTAQAMPEPEGMMMERRY